MPKERSQSAAKPNVNPSIVDGSRLHAAAAEALTKFRGDELNAVYEFMAAVIGMGGPAAELIRWGEEMYGYHLCLDYLQNANGRAASKSNMEKRAGATAATGASHVISGRPVRSTIAVQRGMGNAPDAFVKAAISARKSLYDTFKTSDGKSWGDVGAHELHAYHRDGKVADIFLKAVEPILATAKEAERTKPLRDILSMKEFEACVKKAKTIGKEA